MPLLKQLLDAAGVAQSKALCEHFDVQPAGAVRHRPGARHHAPSPSSSPSTARGRGCDICKPVVASILASLGSGYVLDGEQASLQDTNDHFLANLQRDGTYSVVPRIPGGEITPEKLIVIGEVARDFGLYTKITGGQRIDLFGARVEQLPQIWRRLVDAGFESGHAYGKALRTVKSCVGDDLVPVRGAGLGRPGHRAGAALPGAARAAQDQGGGLRLRPRVRRGAQQGLRRHRHRDTAGTSTSAATAASGPATPTCFATDLSTEELIRCIDRFLMFYIRTADRLQRTAAWIEAMDGGLDHLRAVIVDDSLGLCAELDAAMARHVDVVLRRVAATRWTTRSGCAASSPSSTHPTCPTRRSPSRVERGQPVPRTGDAGRHRRPHRGPAGGTAMTTMHADGWTHGLPVRPAGARAGRRRAGRRGAGGALPDPRRQPVRDRQPRPGRRRVRAVPRHRRHPRRRADGGLAACTSRCTTCAPGTAWTCPDVAVRRHAGALPGRHGRGAAATGTDVDGRGRELAGFTVGGDRRPAARRARRAAGAARRPGGARPGAADRAARRRHRAARGRPGACLDRPPDDR